MLETISELLTQNAKIILTSRRSAIFDGEMFSSWLSRYDGAFSINRYKLEKPDISDWLPENRLARLKSCGINITNLSNPVLLGFLRFTKDEDFDSLCNKPEEIVNQYFSSMLEREIDRQELRMSPEKQTELLKIIAEDMCDNNYTADTKENIISLIKSQGSHLLNEVRSNYSPKDKPTIDKLATTLSNHAFFDRSKQGDNNIEFVNEFVFGNYIAESILTQDEWIASDERFVEPAVLSYISRDKNSKYELWIKLNTMSDFLDKSSRMKFEYHLTGRVNECAYNDSEIGSITLKGTTIFETGNIKNSVFNQCTFNNSTFFFENFSDITFLNCKFWDCEFKNSETNQIEINFYNCKDNNDFVYKTENVDHSSEDDAINVSNVALYILSKIWPIGSQSIERLHYFTANLFKTDDFTKRDIVKEVKLLKRKGFLTDANDNSFIGINKAKISEIKTILGRE